MSSEENTKFVLPTKKTDVVTLDIMSARITSTGTSLFSTTEKAKVANSIRKHFHHGSFWVNVTYFAITHDGSSKLTDGDRVDMILSDGGEANLTWSEIGTKLGEELNRNRFTWRRFCATHAQFMIGIFEQADAFSACRTGEDLLFECYGKPPTDAIYIMSWAQKLVPEQLKSWVAGVNSTRVINTNVNYVGQLTTQRVVERSVTGGPGDLTTVKDNVVNK